MYKTTCPHSCGCDDPSEGSLLNTPQDGCPPRCFTSEAWTRRLSGIDCKDDDLATVGRWAREWEAKLVWVVNGSWPRIFRTLCNTSGGTTCSQLFSKLGCGIVGYW